MKIRRVSKGGFLRELIWGLTVQGILYDGESSRQTFVIQSLRNGEACEQKQGLLLLSSVTA